MHAIPKKTYKEFKDSIPKKFLVTKGPKKLPDAKEFKELVGVEIRRYRREKMPRAGNEKGRHKRWLRWMSNVEFDEESWKIIEKIDDDTISYLEKDDSNIEFYIAVYYRLHAVLDDMSFADTIDDLVFDGPLRLQGDPVFTDVPSHIGPTAPFKWPQYVSQKDIENAGPDSGIWLDPHNHLSIPWSPRAEEDLLDEFTGDDTHFLIAALIAPSGAGKTRLVSQWMKPFIANNPDGEWDAGFVDSRESSDWENWVPERNSLIIIDYTYNYGQVMKTIIDRFEDGAPHKIRLLILDHVLPEKFHEDLAWKHRFHESGIVERKSGLFFKRFPIVLKPQEDQSELLRDVIAAAADPYSDEKRYERDHPTIVAAADALMKIGKITHSNPTDDEIRKRNSVRHPLFAALIGQTIYQNPETDFTGLARRDLITQYFEHGRRIPWNFDDKRNEGAKILGPWVGCFVCAATLLRGLSVRDGFQSLPNHVRAAFSEANTLPDLEQFSNRIVSWNDPHTIKPFEPDILGEAFLLKFVERFDGHDEVFGAFIRMLSTFRSQKQEQASVSSVLESLQRLVRNLINDSQDTTEVKDSWETLLALLDPHRFTLSRLMRQAISIALCDVIKQTKRTGPSDLVSRFAEQVIVADLEDASSNILWKEAAAAFVHYFDWTTDEEQSDEPETTALFTILSNFMERSEKQWPALMLAAYEGCLNTAKFVEQLFGEDVNSYEVDGWSVLMMASQQGQRSVVEWLIQKKANVDFTGMEEGWTALMAASLAGQSDVVGLLIEAQANVNQPTTDNGWTALMVASLAGQSDVVSLLIKAKAKVNQKATDNGWTALMVASHAGRSDVVRLLIEAKANVNHAAKDNGWTALMVASQEGQSDVVSLLIKAQANVNHGRTDDGWTALMTASHAGRSDVVRLLIKAQADVNQGTTDNGSTALMTASQEGQSDVVGLLIEAQANVNQGRKNDGWTALMTASHAGQSDVVGLLIEAKANVNQGRTDDAWTALMAASLAGRSDVVGLLIEAKANVNQATQDNGWTALMAASLAGQSDVVGLLIEAKANANQRRTDDGSTALMVASQEGQSDVVRLLIKAKAKVNQKATDNAWTALMAASLAGRSDVVGLLIEAKANVNQATKDNGWTALMVAGHAGRSDVVGLLIEAKANVNQGTTDNGWTALMTASHAGRSDVVRLLIKAQADVNQGTTDNGSTALMTASQEGQSDVVQLLIKAQADVNQGTTDNGWTALMTASQEGQSDVVQLLIEAQADVNQGTTDNGWTALMAASQEGRRDVVSLLIEAQADVNQGTTDNGWTALMAASEEGYLVVVEYLTSNGAKIDKATTNIGATALMIAGKYGHKDIVEYLIQMKRSDGLK